MAFTKEDEIKFRAIVQEEILKSFRAGVKEVMTTRISENDISSESQTARNQQKNLAKMFADAFLKGMQREERNARASQYDESDPERAESIRKFYGEF